MKLHVRSLPLVDVINDLSRQMDVEVEEDCEEYTLKIPKKLGTGIIRGVNFSFGLGLIEYYCTFKTDVEILFTLNSIHPLKFIFCSEGVVKHSFTENKDEDSVIELHQNVIVASTKNNGHILKFLKNTTFHMNSLEIKRDEFREKTECLPLNIKAPLESLLKDVKAKKLFFYHGNYSLAMADTIREINECKETGFVRKTFLEAKALEMLTLQIKNFEEKDPFHKSGGITQKSEFATIERAVKFIEKNLSKNFTVKELARNVGTNPTNLQNGFKKQYNNTVNGFINEKRMEFAREEIINGELNISEIAQKVGLKNKSYFSRLFRERFGSNPKQFSQKQKY